MLTTNRLHSRMATWDLFNQLHQDFSRELSDWFTAGAEPESGLGVWTKNNEAIVALELPGRDISDIDVSVHRHTITVETGPRQEALPEGARLLRQERSMGQMRRQLQLPFELDPEKVEASYERGLLVLRLNAHESAQPARIEVKAG